MKKVIIANGMSERHTNLHVDTLVVYGNLIVDGVIRAKRITGNGTITAKRINAKSIKMDTIECEHIGCKNLIVNELFCNSATVKEEIIAYEYIEADCLKTHKLISYIHSIHKLEANILMNLQSCKKNRFKIFIQSWAAEISRHQKQKRLFQIQTKKRKEVEKIKNHSKEDKEFAEFMKIIARKYKEGNCTITIDYTNNETAEDVA